MPAYLLLWNARDNPDDWPPSELESGEDVYWTCGRHRSIPKGSRAFVLKQRLEPRGVVASGWITEEPKLENDGPWDGQYRVYFEIENPLDLATQVPLDCRGLVSKSGRKFPSRVLQSGTKIDDELAETLKEAWQAHLGGTYDGRERRESEAWAREGTETERLTVDRSRDRSLRESKLNEAQRLSPDGRIRCEVRGCGFDFEGVYGSIGKRFAHVHHKYPLHMTGETTTRLEDLAVVCANCHAMIHRGGECRPLEDLIQHRDGEG